MPRRAFTLLEALVAIAIIGILLALLLPAVQSAREAARRTQCRSNMHQLGIALHSYHDVYGMFPLRSSNYKSLHVAILPYIDQQALFDRFPDLLTMESHNRLAGYPVPLFWCPSDPNAPHSGTGSVPIYATSYAGNLGTGVQAYGYNGVFSNGRVRVADITDGSSQTAAMAEWLVATARLRDRRRGEWRTPYELLGPDQLEQFAHLCRETAYSPTPPSTFSKGRPWVEGGGYATEYNHVLFPNDVTCLNGTKVQEGAYSAGSEHPGGVQILFADGHVGFVSTQVDFVLWRAIGSRAGGESVAVTH
jgi:prepilin-type N-terminal cleavage/methylation domain-containing protein/prepilin-type processing-associated H-X9-DG protein